MGTTSREAIYGASVRAAAEQAAGARKTADRLACEAWNKRMLGFQGPAQPSPALGDALNAGYLYLEVKCLGCNTHQTVALNIVRRPKSTPIYELERHMRCKDCSQLQGRAHIHPNSGSCSPIDNRSLSDKQSTYVGSFGSIIRRTICTTGSASGVTSRSRRSNPSAVNSLSCSLASAA